jgi:hypothetical protein
VQLTPIRVECYAGHQAEETPRRFLWQGEWVEVVEVVDRWCQVETRPEWPRADYFKVLVPNAGEFLLKHDRESGEWFVGRHWSPHASVPVRGV